MKIFILIVSFLLEGVVSNFVPVNGFFAPLFTLITLIVIYPLFDENSNYYKYAFITGLAYDLFYTDTIIFHAIIFSFMAVIIRRLNTVLSDNFINILITLVLSIVFYRVITYGFLSFRGAVSFEFRALGFSILKSLFLNLIYGMILFLIMTRFLMKRDYRLKSW